MQPGFFRLLTFCCSITRGGAYVLPADISGSLTAQQPAPFTSRLTLSLANASTTRGEQVVLSSCAELSKLTVFGFGLGSIGEEYARISGRVTCCERMASCCRAHSPCAVILERPLRFVHEKGERIDVFLPDSVQLPVGIALTEPPNADRHAVRAVQVASRAHEWIHLYARVVATGPDKWPLRHLLLSLAIALIGLCCCAVIIQCCYRVQSRK